mmetsp:Transcript_80175/g.160023  ORF Transcript_80175/g.160023 Transcript_80175/m.160023 type:complete len:200 (+) Transcript_80175:1172-1771(+)
MGTATGATAVMRTQRNGVKYDAIASLLGPVQRALGMISPKISTEKTATTTASSRGMQSLKKVGNASLKSELHSNKVTRTRWRGVVLVSGSNRSAKKCSSTVPHFFFTRRSTASRLTTERVRPEARAAPQMHTKHMIKEKVKSAILKSSRLPGRYFSMRCPWFEEQDSMILSHAAIICWSDPEIHPCCRRRPIQLSMTFK